MVKLADTQDLGSCAFGRGGSTPPFRTSYSANNTIDRAITAIPAITP